MENKEDTKRREEGAYTIMLQMSDMPKKLALSTLGRVKELIEANSILFDN